MAYFGVRSDVDGRIFEIRLHGHYDPTHRINMDDFRITVGAIVKVYSKSPDVYTSCKYIAQEVVDYLGDDINLIWAECKVTTDDGTSYCVAAERELIPA